MAHAFAGILLVLTFGLIAASGAAAVPVASFTAAQDPAHPLNVTFTSTSTGSPAGWSWYFGDENYSGQAWIPVRPDDDASTEWSTRAGHSAVALPDGSIVLTGGFHGNMTWNGDLGDVWRSEDGGASWTCVNAGPGWGPRRAHSTAVLADGSILLTGGTCNSLPFLNDTWRSTDRGETWTCMNASGGWTGRYGHATVALPDGSIVLMGGGGNDFYRDVWRSDDCGAHWTRVSTQGGRMGSTAQVLPDGSIVVMGGTVYGSFNEVWRSADRGATWTRVNSSAPWAAEDAASAVLPDGSIVHMGGYTDGQRWNDTWRSMDKGATWTCLTAHAGWPARSGPVVVTLPNGSIVLMGGYPGAYSNDVWRFDTASSVLENTVHTYAKPGIFPVTLRAFNSENFNSSIANFRVKGGTKTLIVSSKNPSRKGDPVRFTATIKPVSPATGKRTGTVQFSVDGKKIGTPVALSGTGKAVSRALSTLAKGLHNVTASYSGDKKFLNSTRNLTQKVT